MKKEEEGEEEEEEEEMDEEDESKPLLTVETMSVHTSQVRERSPDVKQEKEGASSSCAPDVTCKRNGIADGESEHHQSVETEEWKEETEEEGEEEKWSITAVVDEAPFSADLPTPTIPLQPQVWERRKRTSSVPQLPDRDEVVQPETPRESEGGVVGKEKPDFTASKRRRKESTPQILSGLVFCVVDYPQLMDAPTMEKWREVRKRERERAGACIVLLLAPAGSGTAWRRTDRGI